MLFGLAILILSVAGSLYTLLAARLIEPPVPAPAGDEPAVSILKPLKGAEPRLRENLSTFLRQDYAGAVQLLCGVQDPSDPAIACVEALRAVHPGADITLVVDGARHGANGKVSNLVNMLRAARHGRLILSDSDIAVDSSYLRRLARALEAPDVGAATCLYHGRGDAGFWSRLAAMGIDHQFLPGVVTGLRLGLAKPCMGSTIALDRALLDRIGGFARFADVLADDYAIGEAVRAEGLGVAVPAMFVAHGCAETSLAALVRHELRWQATVRRIDPPGHAGSIVTHPLPLALIGAALAPLPGLGAILIALVSRHLLALRVGGATGSRAGPLWLLPLRDLLSFALFVASFATRSVDWRGARLNVEGDGKLSNDG